MSLKNHCNKRKVQTALSNAILNTDDDNNNDSNKNNSNNNSNINNSNVIMIKLIIIIIIIKQYTKPKDTNNKY